MAVRTESMNGMYLEGSDRVHTCSLGMVINTTPTVSCQAVGWGSKSEWHDIFLSELRIMKLVNPKLQVPKVRNEAGTLGTTYLAGEHTGHGFSVFWNRGLLLPNVVSQKMSCPV